jgi:hypothetical protein
MALVYRTIFSDRREDLPSAVRSAFIAWLESKDVPLILPEVGTVVDDSFELEAAETQGEVTAVQFTLHEKRGQEQWSTIVTAIDDGRDPCVWVDLERTSSDPYGRPPLVAAPRLVLALLENGTSHIGPTPLSVEPKLTDDANLDDLVRQLLDLERRIPLVVMSKDRYATPETSSDRGRELLSRIGGLAPVFVLDSLATSLLSEVLGSDLQVVGGAVRTYLPDLTIPDREPKRHPYIAGTVFASQPTAAATRIQRSLTPSAIALSPPQVYRDSIAYLPGFPRHQETPGGDEFLTDLINVEDERDRLLGDLASVRDDLEFSALQLDEAEAELDSAQARVRYLETRLRVAGDKAANEPTPPSAIPDTAESCTEAIGFTRQYLSKLEVGDTDYYTAALDTYMKSPSWARKAWRALRALNDYAELKATGYSGDFLAYCADNPLGLTVIPTGWVTLKESESTDNNPRFRVARTFPVPFEVDDTGEVYMRAHIKIEAGGRPAPRIHFYDDSAGDTGAIHVGYFGEHLPSDQSN